MAVAEKRYDDAKRAWRESLARRPSAWAYRHLAALAMLQEDCAEAAELYPHAVRLAPGYARLVAECGKALIDSGQSARWLALLEDLPPATRAIGRIRMLEARAALDVGDLDRVPALLAEGLLIHDLREGETEPTRLWFAYQQQRLAAEEGVPIDDRLEQRVRRDYPPPRHLDFRMH
jgi:predicted Zn-dependent protease